MRSKSGKSEIWRTSWSRRSARARPTLWAGTRRSTRRLELLLAIMERPRSRGRQGHLCAPTRRCPRARCWSTAATSRASATRSPRRWPAPRRRPPLRVHQVERPASSRPPSESFIARGGRLRVITTTYMGATDRRALDRLGRARRRGQDLLRHRTHPAARQGLAVPPQSGFSTAYVGSSNLSHAALSTAWSGTSGSARAEQPHLVDKFAATFETYWDDPAFEAYDPERDAERLESRIARQRGAAPTLSPRSPTSTSGRTRYQQEILDDLHAEREVHGRHRNLVVAATGTGKTVVAALDYRGCRDAGARATPALRRAPRGDPRAEPARRSARCCGTAASASSASAASDPSAVASTSSRRSRSLIAHGPRRPRAATLRRGHRRRVPPRRGADLPPLLEHLQPRSCSA